MDIIIFEKYWLYFLGLPKTILFNLWYFPLMTAIRFPVFVSHRVFLKKMKGSVELGEIKIGVVKIGFGEVAIFDSQKSRTIWNVTGKVKFCGQALIGHGSKISVSGVLCLGNMFTISAESTIVANERVVIGENVMLSWDILIIDSDLHNIYDSQNNLINQPREISVGNNVWIGCRSLVLKGSRIADGIIIAAGTRVASKVEHSYSIVGVNSPIQALKTDIRWIR